MNEQADQPATPGNPAENPGQTLRKAREALGWSVEQVADQLKLATRQVVALEAGDYAALPSPAVTRGFVRAYAKLVRVDPAPLVAMIEIDVPAETQATHSVRREARPTTFSEARFPLGQKRSRAPLVAAGAVVVIAAALGAAWKFNLLPGFGSEPAPAETAPVTEDIVPPAIVTAEPGGVADTGLHDPSVPLISVPGQTPSQVNPETAPAAAPANAAQAPATPGVATPGVATPGVATPGAATITPAATTPATTTPAATPVAAPAAANSLVLQVREDSWIEVRPRAGGKPLISRLVKGGTTETVEVTGPVSLVVGVPGGVSATLRGQAVALPPVPGKTLSRVTLQ